MSAEHALTSENSSADLIPSSNDLKLSQHIQEQTQLIEDLTRCIQQKEQKLAELNEQTGLMDKLAFKLQENELAMYVIREQVQIQTYLMDQLSSKLKEKEQQTPTVEKQSQLIKDLTAKLQGLEQQLTLIVGHNKHMTAQNMVKSHMVAGMALSWMPSPLLDIAALSGVQLNLLRQLCQHYALEFDEQLGKGLSSALVSGALPVVAVLGLSSLTKLLPGIGTIGGSVSMTILTGATLYATGQVFIHHFEAGGTLQNFNSQQWQVFFRQQLAKGKTLVKSQLNSVSSTAAQPVSTAPVAVMAG